MQDSGAGGNKSANSVGGYEHFRSTWVSCPGSARAKGPHSRYMEKGDCLGHDSSRRLDQPLAAVGG